MLIKQLGRVAEGGANIIPAIIYFIQDLAEVVTGEDYFDEDWRFRFNFSGGPIIQTYSTEKRTYWEKVRDATVLYPTGIFLADTGANFILGYNDPNVMHKPVGQEFREQFDRQLIPLGLTLYAGGKFVKSTLSKPVIYPADSITFKGEVFRYENYQYMDTTWTIHEWNIQSSHRYSGSGKGALYSSLDAWTAFKEVKSDLGRWFTVKGAKVKGILDLTDPKTRQNLGISLRDITKKGKYDITQGLGDLIRNRGYKGILAPSAQNPGGVNLVLFDVKMLFNKIR